MTTIIRKQTSHHWQGNPIHPLLQRIYLLRDVLSAEEIEHDLKGLLPFASLSNIREAVKCLVEALLLQQRILIIVDFLVPNRFEYGYGLTPEIVTVAKAKNPDVIITVDNGISSIAGVKAANQAGIKVLITDHHLMGEQLPNTFAIFNPNLPHDPFPSKH